MKFNLSSRSYAKILLHTSKYPHKAVNGVLLGGETVQDGEVYVLDAVPLFHICLGLAPMLEVALARVRQEAFFFALATFLLFSRESATNFEKVPTVSAIKNANKSTSNTFFSFAILIYKSKLTLWKILLVLNV